jgi:tRNA dimethylallyltransferase
MVVAILAGPTAVGKSALALRLAEANGFEIISADSRQIYVGFRIGTGAPTEAEAARVPHHLVGFLPPSESFSHREFPARVHALMAERPEARFLVVGGTGLYLKELLFPAAKDRGPTPAAVRDEVLERMSREGSQALHAQLLALDPDSLQGVHPNDAYRVARRWENHLITGESYSAFAAPAAEAGVVDAAGAAGAMKDARFADTPVLILEEDREDLYHRIDERVGEMMAAGWLDEVKALMSHPAWRDFPAMSSLGYAELASVAGGATSLEDALHAIRKRTRHYAKRQATFFRHQFPEAERWRPTALRIALEAARWDWERFRKSSRMEALEGPKP